ncbi:MAG: DUF1343 domain-containing protein, partial [Bradymonadia bacterium]
RCFEPLRAGLHMLGSLSRLYSDHFGWRTDAYEFVKDRLAIDLLFGGPSARELIEKRAEAEQLDHLYSSWMEVGRVFHAQNQSALLYERP